jgi:hypothetical protein
MTEQSTISSLPSEAAPFVLVARLIQRRVVPPIPHMAGR